jgi:peptidoglycan-associated lipoprotein
MLISRKGLVRVVCILAALAFTASCSCRTRKGAEGNIPVAEAGGALKDVHYAFDSFELDMDAQSVLKKNASWLTANPDTKVEVEGHCDERGTAEYNLALGEKRARAAADYLRSLGIAGDRLSTVSYGEELPLDPRHNESAWSKNRRAHFSVNE